MSLAVISTKRGTFHLPRNSRLKLEPELVELNSGHRAVFLDRDGVLIEDVGFIRDPGQIRFLEGTFSALKLLQQFFFLIVATNQSGIARGYFDENDLLCIHKNMINQLNQSGVIVDALYYCPHLSNGVVEEYAVDCQCRKPKPGLLLRAQKDWSLDLTGSYMIGDQPRDVMAGIKAGVKGILLNGKSETDLNESWTASDLISAAGLVLSKTQVSTLNLLR